MGDSVFFLLNTGFPPENRMGDRGNFWPWKADGKQFLRKFRGKEEGLW